MSMHETGNNQECLSKERAPQYGKRSPLPEIRKESGLPDAFPGRELGLMALVFVGFLVMMVVVIGR